MSVIPCYRGGHLCSWPACPQDCDGRPGASHPTGLLSLREKVLDWVRLHPDGVSITDFIKITFPDEKWKWTDIEGRKRQGYHEPHHKGAKRYNSKKPWTEHVMGFRGETCIRVVSNVPLDLDRKPGGDNGIDFSFHLGNEKFTIDVKASSNEDANLKIKFGQLEKMEKAGLLENHFYVHCYIDNFDRTGTIFGWCFGADVKKIYSKIIEPGKTIKEYQYEVPRNCLYPIKLLLDFIKENEKTVDE